jgi:simple sugar transport system permease protein
MTVVEILSLLIVSTLIYATPLVLTSIGGVFSERSGVVNVGLEGIMVMGAFAAVVFNLEMADTFGDLTPWIATIVGGLVGVLFATLHAVATIQFRADHIISGTVLNLMAPALAVFLVRVLYGKGQTDNMSHAFKYLDVAWLKKIPLIGDLFFNHVYLINYVAILIAFISWFIIFKTRFGLRLRSVGEHPQAADTLGINVYFYKYAGVLISGFLGGLGGAVFAQTVSVNFAASTISGQGFISMAAMIFGKWNPIGAMGAALFFGLAQSLAVIGGQLPVIQDIPTVYLQCAPYVLTIIVLAAFLGKSAAPKADGVNYIKSK